MRRLALPLICAAAPLLGCINTDAAVFVAPTLSSPILNVSTTNPLGVGLSGSFVLDLHLGARASGPSTVAMPQFSLVDPTTNADIVSPLNFTGDQTFPLTVAPDSDVVLHATFETGAVLLPKSDATALCPPNSVVLSGKLTDSLTGGATPTPVSTAPFTPTCQ